MNIKELTNKELIKLYKEYKCSLQAIEKDLGLTKNQAGRLFRARNIDYKSLKNQYLIDLEMDYYNHPNVCKYCGNPLPYKYKGSFCNQSCAASYNNIQRRTSEHKNKGPQKNYHCLNCGKELKYVSGNYMKYCSAKCQTEYQHKEYIKRWKNGEETGVTGKTDISTHIRKYLKEKFNNSCQKCGWNQINYFTGLVPLQIHHIDGDCLNNKEKNLQLLCPNCHALTENYGSRNKNSKRTSRRIHYENNY